MAVVDISHIDINFPSHAYTIEELVDGVLGDKLEEEVKRFSKKQLGIEKVYKAYD